MAEVSAAWFANADGHRLLATVHAPEQRNVSLPVVVLLSPGVKMRMGPGRLYVPLTEALNRMGYLVMRFDFYGLGDSEGELQETVLADVYNNIEVGRYVGDTRCALEWLRREYGASSFVLGGLCGGAITALLSAQLEPQVVGLLSIGMTVTLASNAATPAAYLTRGQLDERRKGYYQRLFKPMSWWRLLTFQSEYGVIWRSLGQGLGRFLGKAPKVAPAPPPTAAPTEQRGNANPLFPPAFLEFLGRGGTALMLFSEKDRLFSEYDEKFRQPCQQQLVAFESQLTNHLVKDANHVLSFSAWQREMVTVACDWMRTLEK